MRALCDKAFAAHQHKMRGAPVNLCRDFGKLTSRFGFQSREGATLASSSKTGGGGAGGGGGATATAALLPFPPFWPARGGDGAGAAAGGGSGGGSGCRWRSDSITRAGKRPEFSTRTFAQWLGAGSSLHVGTQNITAQRRDQK